MKQRQSYFGVSLNIPNLEDLKIDELNIEPFVKTAQRFGNLAQTYEELSSSYQKGLYEGVIEGGKLGIKKGIELTEDEAKSAVKDYQQQIASQAKQIVQQAQQQTKQLAQVIDFSVEQKNRIAFSNPNDPNEILHVNNLQDMLNELSRLSGKQISDKYIKGKPFNHLNYGQWDTFTWDNVIFKAVEKWGFSDIGSKDRNRYLSSKNIPIPTKVSTPIKKQKGGKT